MRRNMRFGAALAAAGLAAALTVPAADGENAEDEGAVDYRQHTMSAIGGHMQAIADIVRGKVAHTGHLPVHAGALAELAELVPSLFAAGTAGGDTLPAVWEDAEDFQAKTAAFKEATANLVAAAQSGAELRSALGAVGQACKNCHDGYRAK